MDSKKEQGCLTINSNTKFTLLHKIQSKSQKYRMVIHSDRQKEES